LRDEVNGFPIQLAKVQRPVLRDETLERPRLLDWLRGKANGRVILVIADAGYGKTTLLADFSRRTRLRTLWYRLDDDDRDWVSFLHHLVAAGREHDPDFAPSTAAALADARDGGTTRESALATFLTELSSITAGGALLVFDDFHLVDDAPDVRHIARELVGRAPDRLSIVFASRRVPAIPLARLRAVGDVAELDTDDLRFDAVETEQLFTQTYGRRLDPDVLVDLTTRTEGWIASLQMVQAALRERSPAEIRRFVRGLSGADHELYDYLAEEVVGDLDEDVQRFLMETSILQIVTPGLAELVTGAATAEVARLTTLAERLTLLSRASGSPRTHRRYHPLVRGFLEARFRSLAGVEVVRSLHRRVAVATAAADWRTAAHHYREAGDTNAMLDVVRGAIPTIMGNGQYALAEAFIGQVAPGQRSPELDLIVSRVDMQQGDFAAAVEASQAVLDSGVEDPIQRDHALLNLLTLHTNHGDGQQAIRLAEALGSVTSDPNLRLIASASEQLLAAADEGDVEVPARTLTRMASAQREGFPHHHGVTTFNLAWIALLQDRPKDAINLARESMSALELTSSRVERSASRMLLASALSATGELGEALHIVDETVAESTAGTENELLIEAADMFDSFATPELADSLLERIGSQAPLSPECSRMAALVHARAFIRRGDCGRARLTLAGYPAGVATTPGMKSAFLATSAYLACAESSEGAVALAREAAEHAARQHAHRWARIARLIEAIADGGSLEKSILAVAGSSPWSLAFLAELIVPKLEQFGHEGERAIATVVSAYPGRWRTVLRSRLDESSDAGRRSAVLLHLVGEQQDIGRLRTVERRWRRGGSTNLGRSLARRLAEPVFIEDQGRVQVRVGPRCVPGTAIRRKVLALVCFLLTRPAMSATRDQVLEALWPGLDPMLAVNSLNQTLYFLRRVFEQDYTEELSPGYVVHDSDIVWLDPELVGSRSINCRDFIRELPRRPSPDDVELLVGMYMGRFALDFEYEEWAGPYRDSLHASYLEIVERSVLDDLQSGHFDRGIRVARRALEVDPGADQVEVSLLRLYRATSAHSAAAEQYSHYASVLREELGEEPPPLDSL
jgi:ATP/maltotriose-dependent transcriptional regulator MalT/DNA-binding SARP family transcriptional activator